jgi:hypothetical protein
LAKATEESYAQLGMPKPAEEKPSSASAPTSRPRPNIRQMYLDLAKQWKELAEHAVAIERHRRSGLITMPIEE